MNKRKIRFNAVDALIIVVLLAVIYVILNIFVFGEKNEIVGENYTTIRYVIELNNVDSKFADKIKEGDAVQEAVKKKMIGTVVGVQSDDYKISVFDYIENREVVSPVNKKSSIKVTIEAKAVESESDYLVDNYVIKAGKQYSLIFPSMYAVGYCVDLRDSQQ